MEPSPKSDQEKEQEVLNKLQELSILMNDISQEKKIRCLSFVQDFMLMQQKKVAGSSQQSPTVSKKRTHNTSESSALNQQKLSQKSFPGQTTDPRESMLEQLAKDFLKVFILHEKIEKMLFSNHSENKEGWSTIPKQLENEKQKLKAQLEILAKKRKKDMFIQEIWQMFSQETKVLQSQKSLQKKHSFSSLLSQSQLNTINEEIFFDDEDIPSIFLVLRSSAKYYEFDGKKIVKPEESKQKSQVPKRFSRKRAEDKDAVLPKSTKNTKADSKETKKEKKESSSDQRRKSPIKEEYSSRKGKNC